MTGRKCALWLAAAISVLTFATAATANGATRERPCNGAVELCSKTLDQVVLPGTHNSMSNEEYGWILPNQHYAIPTQLEYGVRAFLIDTHYGKPSAGSGPSNVADWNNGTDGSPKGVAGTYLCHQNCSWGASDLTAELGKVTDFLASHPREVLIFMVEDGIYPQDFATAVNDSALSDYIYTGPTDSYPTLGEMIASNQRVVVFSENHTGNDSDYAEVPWYHRGYNGPMQETPYNFRKDESNVDLTTQQAMAQLTDSANLNSSCRPNRGGTTGQLFLMNHWVNGLIGSESTGSNFNFTPDPAVAQVLNQPDVLVARAQACEARRGKLPNIVAVDDFGDGDLTDAVRQLNGVTAKPFFEVAKPKGVTVKSGARASFRLQIRNWGSAESALTRVCASVPGKLAIKPKCQTVFVTQANPGKGTATVKVSTRRIYQGRFKGSKSGPVRFTITGGGDSVTTSSTLKVNPLKPKKPKRRN